MSKEKSSQPTGLCGQVCTRFGLADHGSLVIPIVYVYTLRVARPYSGIVCRLHLTLYSAILSQ